MAHLSKDQRFLVDDGVIQRLVDYAHVKQGEKVLEVGAGLGYLTQQIAKKASQVYAIEKDKQLIPLLEEKFRETVNVDIIYADFLKLDLPEFSLIISSLPYSLSRKITERILSLPFTRAVLVYQTEFVEKLLAEPGAHSYRHISVLAQSLADIEVLEKIPKECFNPQPNVSSTAIRITAHTQAEPEYLDFLKTLFSQRGKKLKNIISQTIPKELEAKRPFTLTPHQLQELFTLLKSN